LSSSFAVFVIGGGIMPSVISILSLGFPKYLMPRYLSLGNFGRFLLFSSAPRYFLSELFFYVPVENKVECFVNRK